MKITWLGHSCMQLFWDKSSIVFDPFSPGYVPGLSDVSAEADMVLCSHGHGDHNYSAAVTLKKHGELPFSVSSVSTWHDENHGRDRGGNTIFIVDMPDGTRAVHLGDLGHIPDENQLLQIGSPDALMIPVGGFYTINASTSKKLCDMINPRVIIPMHYKSVDFGFDVLGTVEDFTGLFPADFVKRYDTDTIEITKDTPRQLAVLTYEK